MKQPLSKLKEILSNANLPRQEIITQAQDWYDSQFNKWFFTFGSEQLEWMREQGINPMSVMLVVEAKSEREARNMVFSSKIGPNFCTLYLYAIHADEFKDKYRMDEYTLEEIT